MIVLKYNQTINRNKKGKKVYNGNSSTPVLPKEWQSATKSNTKPLYNNNHIIIPKENLIVIDIDSKKLTKKALKLISKKDYVVKSDNGTVHLYYKPSKKFRAIFPLRNRVKIGNSIDLLQGNSIVFTPNKYNTTKKVYQGSLKNLTKPPKKLTKWLRRLYEDTPLPEPSIKDQKNVSYYMLKDDIERVLNQKNIDYDKDIYPLLAILTPQKFKPLLEPDYHPDKVPDGRGIEYLQALSAKLAGDISVSPELHKFLIRYIAQELWSDPLSDAKLRAFLSNLETQKYADGSLVFQYDPNATKNNILISTNGSPLYPLYRTLDDNYLIIKENKITEVKGFTNIKRFIQSRNVKAMVNGRNIREFKTDYIELIKSVTVTTDKSLPSGLTLKEYELYYNYVENTQFFDRLFHIQNYTPTKIRVKKDSIVVPEWDKMPTIAKLFHSITYDHSQQKGEQEQTLSNLLLFLSRKLTTLDYSPIVLQLLGAQGTGKSLFVHFLDILTNGVKEIVLESNFNAEYENSIFLYEDEGSLSNSVINRIKQLSGNTIMRIEGKGQNARYEKNLATIIVNSNKFSTMATTQFDRRFVALCSFNAPRLHIDISSLIDEMDYFVDTLLTLRDYEDLGKKLYMDAQYWQNYTSLLLLSGRIEAQINYSTPEETKEESLALLLQNYRELDSYDIYKTLNDIFGHNFTFICKNNHIRIPLNKRSMRMEIDGQEIVNSYLSNQKLHKLGVKPVRSTLKGYSNVMMIDLPVELSGYIKEHLKKSNCFNRKSFKFLEKLKKL